MDGTVQTDTTAEAALHAARIEELRTRIGDAEGLIVSLGCIAELLAAVANTTIQVEMSCLFPVVDATREAAEKLDAWFKGTIAAARGMAR